MAGTSSRRRRAAPFADSCEPSVRCPSCRVRGSSVEELRAGPEGFDHRADAIAARRKSRVHPLDERFVRQQRRPAQRIYQQLTTEIVEKIFFTCRADIRL